MFAAGDAATILDSAWEEPLDQDPSAKPPASHPPKREPYKPSSEAESREAVGRTEFAEQIAESAAQRVSASVQALLEKELSPVRSELATLRGEVRNTRALAKAQIPEGQNPAPTAARLKQTRAASVLSLIAKGLFGLSAILTASTISAAFDGKVTVQTGILVVISTVILVLSGGFCWFLGREES